jgi:hypothetical protein
MESKLLELGEVIEAFNTGKYSRRKYPNVTAIQCAKKRPQRSVR